MLTGLVSAHMHRLRQESGIVALEFLLVVFVWLVALAFLLDICIVLGNGVVMQAAVNRAALQATAQGCVSPESAANVSDLTKLLAENITLNATWASRSGYDRDATLNAVQNGDSAGLCPNSIALGGGDVVPQGEYIFLDLEYDQHILMFPSIHVRKTALAISSSFNLESSSP